MADNKNMMQNAWEQVKDGAEAASDVVKQAVESTVDATKSATKQVKNKMD